MVTDRHTDKPTPVKTYSIAFAGIKIVKRNKLNAFANTVGRRRPINETKAIALVVFCDLMSVIGADPLLVAPRPRPATLSSDGISGRNESNIYIELTASRLGCALLKSRHMTPVAV